MHPNTVTTLATCAGKFATVADPGAQPQTVRVKEQCGLFKVEGADGTYGSRSVGMESFSGPTDPPLSLENAMTSRIRNSDVHHFAMETIDSGRTSFQFSHFSSPPHPNFVVSSLHGRFVVAHPARSARIDIEDDMSPPTCWTQTRFFQTQQLRVPSKLHAKIKPANNRYELVRLIHKREFGET